MFSMLIRYLSFIEKYSSQHGREVPGDLGELSLGVAEFAEGWDLSRDVML